MIQPQSIVQLMAHGPDERRKCKHLSLLSENLQYLLWPTLIPGKYFEKGANVGKPWCQNKSPETRFNLLSEFGQLSALYSNHGSLMGILLHGNALDENLQVCVLVPYRRLPYRRQNAMPDIWHLATLCLGPSIHPN